MLKHQPPFINSLSTFHAIPWKVQLTYQIFPIKLISEKQNISSQELVSNVLRFLIFSAEALECKLELFPPNRSTGLFPIANAYIVSANNRNSIPNIKQATDKFLDIEENMHHPKFGKIGRLLFSSIPSQRYPQIKNIINLISPFFGQLYKILFYQAEYLRLKQSYTQMLYHISNNIEPNKLHMQAHNTHTADLAKRIASQMGFNNEQSLLFYFAGIFHDIGKIIVPEAILNKPTSLEENEWDLVKNHASFGASLFEPLDDLHKIIPIIRGHHEWMNGCGYPDRLAGEQIPHGARILSVADAYSTMIDGRAYQNKRSSLQAQDELIRFKNTQFDPHIVDALISIL